LNVDGFFDHLLRFLTYAVDTGFIPGPLVNGLIVSDDPVTLLDELAHAADSSTPGN
jgi:predicted Rossmann-fold nucleotide-binding protein